MVNAISTIEIRDEAAKTVLFKVDVVDVVDLLPPSWAGVCGLCMQAPSYFLRHAVGALWGGARRKVVRFKIIDLGAWQSGFTTNLISDFFRQHDGGGVQIAGNDVRHDGRINHAQTVQTMHASLAVRHRIVALTHRAGAGRVIGGFGVLTHIFVQLRIGANVLGRGNDAPTVGIQCRLIHDLAGDADGGAKLLSILLMRHVVEQNTGVLLGIA